MSKVIISSLFLPEQFDLTNASSGNLEISINKQDKPHVVCRRANNVALYDGVKALEKNGQCIEWVGMPGVGIPDDMRHSVTTILTKDYKSHPVYVDQKLHSGHYEVFCKSVLWPLFHFTIGSGTIITQADNEAWTYYVRVNELFAEEIVKAYQQGDDVWIHGYHLMLVPQLVRKKLPRASIGFFMHIPFPNTEIFRCLPRRTEILSGLLGSTLLGFQTYADARHFLHSCTRVLGFETTPTGVVLDPGFVHVGVFPVGIDVSSLNAKRKSPSVLAKQISFADDTFGGRKVIVGRDKLDFMDGIRHKFMAFEAFLKRYPEWREKVVLVQVTEPTIEQRHAHLESSLASIVSHINSRYGSISMLPILHYRTAIDEVEYMALLGMADVCLVTSLRDGMNLISHEYVVCQQEKHGCLLLSEFTGSAGSLSTAMHINPWDHHGVAAALHEALCMSEDEKALKHQQVMSFVSRHTAAFWSQSFIEDLRRAVSSVDTSRAPLLHPTLLRDGYASSHHRLFLFDYDGTLTSIRRTPLAAKPSQKLLSILQKLLEDPKNTIFIVSGRDQAILEEWLGQIPRLGLSAEHGCFLRLPLDEECPELEDDLDRHRIKMHSNEGIKEEEEDGAVELKTTGRCGSLKDMIKSTSWLSLTDELDFSWKSDVLTAFEYYTERTPGSFIEHKKSSITWHYRLADPQYGSWQAKECQAHLESLVISKFPIEILAGKKNLEVRPIVTNKGEVVRRILSLYGDTDFVFCAGDDRTDEDMFRFLKTLEHQHTRQESEGNHQNFALSATHNDSKSTSSTDTLKVASPTSRSLANLKLPEMMVTCTVGVKATQASYHVPDTETLLELLQILAYQS